MNLSNTQLFRGFRAAEITNLLNCLNATEHSYKKGEVILFGRKYHGKYRNCALWHGDDIVQ